MPDGWDSNEKKVGLAIRLARANVVKKTGGPFGAAVFTNRGRLVSVGVNCVLGQRSSVAHAEIMAIMLAQRTLGASRLDKKGEGGFVLASSAQPCAMCLGALVWSGVSSLAYGAPRADVEEMAGFDEGPYPDGWRRQLRLRGITVSGGVLRRRAVSVLRMYRQRGGVLY